MAKDIKGVFDELAPRLNMNQVAANRIRQYNTQFVTRNDDHVNFFGSGLLGVYPIRWFPKDKSWWWDDILKASEKDITRELHSLPTVNKDFNVAGDPTNLSYIYVLNQIYNEDKMSDRVKHDTMVAVIRIMHYKFMSSIFSHYFKYPADKRVAEATYACLSKKFALKTCGSWGELINKRTEDILDPKGIHRNAYTKMNDDDAVTYMVTDIQSRIREVVKAMMPIFYTVLENNKGFTTTTSVIEIDGQAVLKDKKRGYSSFMRYIYSIVPDRDNFIRQDLVDVVSDAMHTMSPKMFMEALVYISAHSDDEPVQELVKETLLHAFEFIEKNRLSTADIAVIISRLRMVYMASRSSNPSLNRMRELADQLVNAAVKRKSSAPPASERTGVILYILLRTLAMQHYSSSAMIV